MYRTGGLQDHPSVMKHPPVPGMLHSVFFWSHNHPEQSGKSKANRKEAQMAVAIAVHLLLQVPLSLVQSESRSHH